MEIRPRRNRKSPAVRAMIRETHLRPDDFIMPLFIEEGTGVKVQIASLPMAFRYSLDRLLEEIEECISLGLKSFILFPKIPQEKKDKIASYSYSKDNFYLKAATEIKNRFPEITLISDVAMDPYNIDGHDGYVVDGKIDNDLSIEILVKMSIAQAKAGFDMLGPSDMMDGRVLAIREALDESGYKDTSILSYTAKYASAMYGPFRDALDSAPVEGANIPKDKKSYQMDPANKEEALLEAALDLEEGADIIMVKPALHYLDIIHLLKDTYQHPVAAYHVSGECAMLWAACDRGWLDYDKAMPETLLSIKRAGADVILTYFAKDYMQNYYGK